MIVGYAVAPVKGLGLGSPSAARIASPLTGTSIPSKYTPLNAELTTPSTPNLTKGGGGGILPHAPGAGAGGLLGSTMMIGSPSGLYSVAPVRIVSKGLG